MSYLYNSWNSFLSHIAEWDSFFVDTFWGTALLFQKILLIIYQWFSWVVKTSHDDFHFLSPIQQQSWYVRPNNALKIVESSRVIIFIFPLNGCPNSFKISKWCIFGRSAESFTASIQAHLRLVNLILLYISRICDRKKNYL